jgi:hypothetical protein
VVRSEFGELTRFNCSMVIIFLCSPAADLGFLTGYGLAEEGERAGGVPFPPGVRGLAPGNLFLKISIENLRFKGHVYAVFMYFSNIILHYIIPKRHQVTMKAIVK